MMGQVFRQITKGQCLEFGVSGKAVRMDSTLIGSDIARYSRYGVVHETIRVSIRKTRERTGAPAAGCGEPSLAGSGDERGGRTGGSSGSGADRNGGGGGSESGRSGSAGGRGIKIAARLKSEISAKSVRSPHDPDCQYRHKGGKEYSVNITETCDRGAQPDDVRAEAVWNAQGVVPEKIEATIGQVMYHNGDSIEGKRSSRYGMGTEHVGKLPPDYWMARRRSGPGGSGRDYYPAVIGICMPNVFWYDPRF
jgi:hypothetical protein